MGDFSAIEREMKRDLGGGRRRREMKSGEKINVEGHAYWLERLVKYGESTLIEVQLFVRKITENKILFLGLTQ